MTTERPTSPPEPVMMTESEFDALIAERIRRLSDWQWINAALDALDKLADQSPETQFVVAEMRLAVEAEDAEHLGNLLLPYILSTLRTVAEDGL